MYKDNVSSMLSAAQDVSLKLVKSESPIKLKDKPWNYFQISVSPSQSLLHVRSGVHLYSYAQVPTYQQHNKYITDGYRSYLSARQCLKSIIIFSNELVNIWTHAGMAFLFLLLMCYDQTFVLPSMRSTISDHFVFLSFSLCVQVCMISSAGYHTFNCHVHNKVAIRWYAIDIFGIILAMLGCYGIGLYYGFYCHNAVRNFYSFTVVSMVMISGALMIHPLYLSDSWHNYRFIHLCSLCVFGLLPTLHWSLVMPSSEVKAFLPGVLTFYAILAVAASVYLTKVPERFFPGKFNFVGQSHNWWHILVGLAMLYWRNFAIQVLTYRVTSSNCFNAVTL